jgi:hypothetical protein
MKVSYRSIGASLSIGFALFGAWSLYTQIAALLGADFATLKAFAFLPVLGAMALLIHRRGKSGPQPSSGSCVREAAGVPRLRLPQWFWLVAPFALAGLYWATRSEWLFWLLSTAYLFAACYTFASDSSDSVPGPMPDSGVSAWELIGLACLCGIAVLLGLGSNRPNADDAFFVSLASSALDNPGAPLFGFDNLYRSGLPLVEQHLHFGQSYEYLVAVLAALTTLPVRVLYYAVLPAIWLPLGILAHWNLLRRFLPNRPALVGLAALVVLLAVWGDGVCTYGNFAFVRVFQGKSICLLVAVPMIVHAALEYRGDPSWRNWLFLMLHQCAAVGFTTNAVLVAPLASAFVLLSGMQLSRSGWRVAAKGFAASVPVALVAIATMSRLRPFRGSEQVDDLLLGYQVVLGSNRTSLILLGLLLLPVLSTMARLRESSWICRYVFLSSALLLCPAVPELIGQSLARVLSWRVFWSWPVPMLLGLTIGAASSRSLARLWLRGCLLGAIVALFALAGPSAVSRSNWAWANIGAFKVPADYRVAQRLMTLAPGGGLALVPEGLAVSLCGFQDAPPLVAVRRLYLEKLRGAIPEQDWAARMDMLAYIGGATGGRSVDWVMGEINRRGVTTVAFRSTHPDADSLMKSLAERGFRITGEAGYVLAARPAPGT